MPLPNPKITAVDEPRRADKNKAKSVMEEITSSPEGRHNGAKVIAEAIVEVNKLGPRKWGVAMYKSDPAIRLIVGAGIYVLTIIEGKIWLPHKYSNSREMLADIAGWDGEYLDLTESSFLEGWEKIRPYFFRGLKQQVVNSKELRKSSKGTHSSGVLDYLRDEFDIDLPTTPGWLNNSNDTAPRQEYSSEQLIKFSKGVFELYRNNFQQDYSLLYSYKPAENKDRIHAIAREIGMNERTAENYSLSLFNLFNRLSENPLNNGLADPPPNLASAGESVYDSDVLIPKHRINQTTYNEELNMQVSDSLALSQDKRQKLLTQPSVEVETMLVMTKQFIRNPHVIAEVLSRANGVCELCGNDAPFIRKSDRTPYLEVHHKQTLAEGGPDIVENAIALCPNCHRKEHFGM